MKKEIELLCEHRCDLGEGPLWHHLRSELLWFDIDQHMLLAMPFSYPPDPSHYQSWQFSSPVSAAGIISREEILIAQAGGLFRFNLDTGERNKVIDLEVNIEDNRSNDSRTAPDGSFWVSTMSYRPEVGRDGAGSIYRYLEGSLVKLFSGLAIPNSICFDNREEVVRCYWSDSKDRRIYYVEVLKEELSQLKEVEKERVMVFCETDKGVPDGSVIDSVHRLWNAEWGAGRLVAYTQEGRKNDEVLLPVNQPSCPAFCGENLDYLAITTASIGLTEAELREQPLAGKSLYTRADVSGIKEYEVFI